MPNRPSASRARLTTTHPATTRPRQRPDPCEDPCTPRCPACGGLKCLCRPRFFAGQLLTEQDLNLLERYILEKNRLHNRYLHGWGVACGLEVVCDACDPGRVVVRSGYALSPCGDDIVVCADQAVDVCALLEACEPREPACEGPYQAPPRDCTGGAKRWVLAICYDERPTRGVTALLGAGDTLAKPSGGCGGTCGKACGCDAGAGPPAKVRAPYKPQCEPTQVCEGYRFVAYPAPKPAALVPEDVRGGKGDQTWAWLYANRARFGPLLERLLCCVTRAMELREDLRQGAAVDSAAGVSVYREYAAALAEFAADFAIHRCAFVARTVELREDAARFDWNAPRLADEAARRAELRARITTLDVTWLDIVSECFCSALLPACPKPASTNCVPLAVVTVSEAGCRVTEICNWSERKLLVTWPAITYWFSWLPWHLLWNWLARMCCGPERSREALALLSSMLGVVLAGQRVTAPHAAARSHRPARASTEASAAHDPLRDALDADDLRAHLLAGFERLRSEGAEATAQPAWAGWVARLSDASAFSPRTADDPRLAGLQRRLEAAEREIAALKKKGGR